MMNVFGNAVWIWDGKSFGENVYLDFSAEFHRNPSSLPCRIAISAHSNYAVYINGSFAGSGQYADYEFHKVYDLLDITQYIRNGSNMIRIVAYCMGRDTSTCRKTFPGVIFAVSEGKNILLESGRNIMVQTDPCFRQGGMEVVSGQLGFTFVYDATLTATQGDARPAVPVTEKDRILYPRPVQKLTLSSECPCRIISSGSFTESRNQAHCLGEKMQYAEVHLSKAPTGGFSLPSDHGIPLTSEDGGICLILDFGKETTGILSLRFDLPCECEILCGWGEHLENVRVPSYIGGRNFCASYRGSKGINRFMNPFLRLGLRYMELHIASPAVRIYYAGIRETLYPLDKDKILLFRCDHALHNRIYDTCLRTLHLCMHEHYEDCPWREQALYAMDSRNQMLCGYEVFGEYRFALASLKLMAMSLRPDGLLELCSPARVPITIPSFSAIYLTQVYEYCLYSGDMTGTKELLPVLLSVADAFIRGIDSASGLISCYKEAQYWNFYEWQDGLSGSISGSVAEEDVTLDAPLNAFVSFGIRSLARLLRLFSMEDRAEYYKTVQAQMNQAINERFWDREHSVYATFVNRKGELSHYCELTNAWIVYTDAAVNDRKDAVLSALASPDGLLLPVTLSHSIFKYEVLLQSPHADASRVFGTVNSFSQIHNSEE